MSKSFADRPGIKRRLTNKQRTKLMILACEKFTDEKLRAVESKAMANLQNAIQAKATEFADDVKVAERYNQVTEFNSILIPYSLSSAEKKTFEKEDGSTVTRYSRTFIQTHFPLHHRMLGSVNWGSMCRFLNGYQDEISIPQHLTYAKSLSIPLDTVVRTLGHNNANMIASEKNDVYSNEDSFLNKESFLRNIVKKPWSVLRNKYDNSHPIFASEEVLKATYEASKAYIERSASEFAMQKAIRSIIGMATTYAQVVDAWPEALELLDDLFPSDGIDKDKQVVAISQDAKDILCANMKSRGVVSPMMCAAE